MLPARGDQVRQGRREAKGKARGRSISNKRSAKLLAGPPQRAVGVRSCGRGRAGRVRVRFGSSARLIQLYRGHRHWSERVCVVWPCRAGPFGAGTGVARSASAVRTRAGRERTAATAGSQFSHFRRRRPRESETTPPGYGRAHTKHAQNTSGPKCPLATR